MIARVSRIEIAAIGAFIAAALFAAQPAAAQVWHSTGLTGGDVRSLASDPRDSSKVYLGTIDGHVFGSSDSGSTWKLLGLAGTNSNAVVTSLIVDPRDSSKIYASTWTRETHGEGGGVFVSLDSGRSWREYGLRAHAVRALVQSPSAPDILVAGALDGVFISRDSGQTWERSSPAGDDELRNFDSLAIDPQNPDIIYAGTFHLPWKTSDGGKHWAPIHSGMIDDSDVLSIAIDSTDAHRIFASACSGIYRSELSGDSWEKLEGIPYSSRRTLVIRQDFAQPSIVYAGTTEGLWQSRDAGHSWRRISPADWIINALILDSPSDSAQGATQPSRILIGTEQQGVLASEDGGVTFQAANEGFYHRRILSAASDTRNSLHLAAVLANAPHAVVESRDGGLTWTPLDAGLRSEIVSAVFDSPTGWWASLESGGLAWYDPAKQSWLRRGTFNSAKPAATTARNPRINDFYVAESVWFAGTGLGLFESRDEGKIWRPLRFAQSDLPVDAVRASSDGQSIQIVSSRGLVFSSDAGETWTWHDLPLDSGGALKLESAGESTLMALARNGVYVSDDGGATWIKQQAGLPSARADQALLRPGMWLVSMASSGLYLSRDEGASWSRLKAGNENSDTALAEAEFPVLVSAGQTDRIFAGSSNEGLFLVEFERSFNAAAQQSRAFAPSGGH